MAQEKVQVECTVEECHAGDCYLPGCACACHGEDTLAGPALPAGCCPFHVTGGRPGLSCGGDRARV
jgi:hypothetical protein